MIPVASLDDPRVAVYRHVADPDRLRADNVFVVEGRLIVPRLLAVSAAEGQWRGCAQSVLVSPAAAEQMRDALASAVVPVYVAPQAIMDALVGFNVHRGCLAIARRAEPIDPDDAAIRQARVVVVLEAVNNPDNVGGIFRTAAAFGVDAVVLGPGCADPLYRKSIRTSMGGTLIVPFVIARHWPETLERMRAVGLQLIALTTSAEASSLGTFVPGARIALLAGAEGAGLSPQAIATADRAVRIPMRSGVDSLNVTTAVSIALYHVTGVSHHP